MPIDYSEYPADWKEIRSRILFRAGELRDKDNNIIQEARCEWCGVRNHGPNFRGSTVILTIAHIDHDKENHAVADDRLAALCQACHLGYDLPNHIYKRKYGSGVAQIPLFETGDTDAR